MFICTTGLAWKTQNFLNSGVSLLTRNHLYLHVLHGHPKRQAKDFQYISEIGSYFGANEWTSVNFFFVCDSGNKPYIWLVPFSYTYSELTSNIPSAHPP